MEPHEAHPRLREIVERCLSSGFDSIAKTAGPLPPKTDFSTLRAGVSDAAAWCLIVHTLAPFRRYADNRKILLRIERHAKVAAAALDALGAQVGDLFPWSRELVLDDWKPASANNDPLAMLAFSAFLARALALIAAKHAHLFRKADKGGRPRMAAFEVLIRSLARVYTSATSRRATVTYDAHGERHGGCFIRLVNALLPAVESLARALNGRVLEQPATEYARGQLIREILQKGRKAENPTTAPGR